MKHKAYLKWFSIFEVVNLLMRTYGFTSGKWLHYLYRSCVWRVPTTDKKVYLTFDDGPHPQITPWVINELNKYNFKATFFCIGDNVRKFTETYEATIAQGFAVGNHTYNHVNGFKTDLQAYLSNIEKCREHVNSKLFRPPYGKILRTQLKGVLPNYTVVMWSQLSGDFDKNLDQQVALKALMDNTKPGHIILFHDSEKAWPNLKELLPAYLAFLHQQGYRAEIF